MKQCHPQRTVGETGRDGLTPEEVDQLYGLEPVINIDEVESEGTEGTRQVVIACPYCGESFETRVDLTGGAFEYVEDCQICCQPITLKVEVSDAAELTGVTALQLND